MPGAYGNPFAIERRPKFFRSSSCKHEGDDAGLGGRSADDGQARNLGQLGRGVVQQFVLVGCGALVAKIV
jgi:hypothetical protein